MPQSAAWALGREIHEDSRIQDLHDDLSAKMRSSESQILALSKEVAEAKAAIKQARVDRQRASENRRVPREIAKAEAAMRQGQINWQRASEDCRMEGQRVDRQRASENRWQLPSFGQQRGPSDAAYEEWQASERREWREQELAIADLRFEVQARELVITGRLLQQLDGERRSRSSPSRISGSSGA